MFVQEEFSVLGISEKTKLLFHARMDVKQVRRERLKSLLKKHGGAWTQAALADKADTKAAYLSQIINETPGAQVGDALARKIEIAANLPRGWMDGLEQYGALPPSMIAKEIDLDEQPDLLRIRRVKFKLSAGVSGYQVEVNGEEGNPIYFRKDWMQLHNYDPAKIMAVRISGASMEPGLFHGDLVVVNLADATPTDGEVFALNYEGELVVKRMKRDAGQWWISSDNQDKRRYPDKICNEEVFILGRVIYKQSERI